MRIDFYSPEEQTPGDRFLLSCHLVNHLYLGGRPRIYLYVPQPDRAQYLDALLWTYRDQSFLPHGRIGQVDPALTPILIGETDAVPWENPQVLINLSTQVPEFFERFERLCEPLDRDPKILEAGRERYRTYRQRDHALYHHRISARFEGF